MISVQRLRADAVLPSYAHPGDAGADICAVETVTLADVEHNLGLVNEPFARDVANSVLNDGRLRVSPYHGQVFTDDLAPVERLIDEIIFGYVTGR